MKYRSLVVFVVIAVVLRVSCSQNLILNGDFQNPRIAPRWRLFNNVPNWVGNLEIGLGTIYNAKWGNTQVVELDANKNEVIKQTVNLKAGTYILSYKYAARTGKVATSQMKVSWNGAVVDDVVPNNDNIVSKSVIVTGVEGANTAEFAGTGPSDGNGMTIDKVELNAPSTTTDASYVINGNFQTPVIRPNWGVFNNPKGWTGQAQIGFGPIYNPRWTSQVSELDVSKNTKISQSFYFTAPGKYAVIYQYAARANNLATSLMDVSWNGEIIDHRVPNDYDIHTIFHSIDAVVGKNTLQFAGAGKSDGYGMTIDNIHIYRFES